MSRKNFLSEGEGGKKLWQDFMQAVRDGDENKVSTILLESPGGQTPHPFLTKRIVTTEGTLTALHEAVKKGQENIVKLLLEKGTNVNAVSQPHQCTALHLAVDQLDGNVRIIQSLLGHNNVKVNETDEFGHTPIKLAAEKGNKEAVKMLLEKGADITIADSVDNTAIHVAADKGHYEVLKLLLPKATAKNPGIIGRLNKDQNTPLHLAARRQCKTTVALLLCCNAAISLEVRNQHNETPKQLAAGNKEIIDILENPSKALQHLQELFRPVNKAIKAIGRGGSVEADNGHPVSEDIPQFASSVLVSGLEGAPVAWQQTPLYLVSASQLTVQNNFTTEVREGAFAAIGPSSRLNVGESAVISGARPHPHPPPAAETSSYHTHVGGGNASIGDQSVINVGTVIPRTPSTAGTMEEPPVFPQQPANREGISSGNPTESENGSNTPGSLSYAVPEVGSAASSADKVIATGDSKVLSYPVPERNNPGIATENASDADAPGELPYSVPEESRSQKAEIPVNRNDVLVTDAGRGDSTKCQGAVTETCGPSNITPTSTAGSLSCSSSERVIGPSEAAAVGTTSGGKAACELKRSSASPGNNKNVQATGSSVDVGAHKLSAADAPSKNNTGWGSALQKNRKSENSKRAGFVSRGAPKDLSKRLLQMSSSPADDTTVGDILQAPRPDLDPASEVSTAYRPLPEFQRFPGGTESKSRGTVCQPHGTAKKEEKQGDERANLVGLYGSQGPLSLVSAEDQKSVDSSNAGASGKVLETVTTSRMSSSSKEVPHRKEKFLRDDSLPDSDVTAEQSQIQKAGNTSRRTATVAGDETVNNAGISGESETQASTDVVLTIVDSENAVLLQNANPEDDVGGMKRCHSTECTIM